MRETIDELAPCIPIDVWTCEDVCAQSIDPLSTLMCKGNQPLGKGGIVVTSPKEWRATNHERAMHVAVRFDDIGNTENRDRDYLSHELAHAEHILRFEFTAHDLANETGVSELADMVFHPYVYWCQTQHGVPASLLARQALLPFYAVPIRHPMDVVSWLKARLGWLSPCQVIGMASAGLQRSDCVDFCSRVVNEVQGAYEGNLEFTTAAQMLRGVGEAKEQLYAV